jgi:RNA polymerase-binding protein DksA
MATNVRATLEKTLRRRREVLVREATEHEAALRAIGEEGESELEDAAQDDQMDRILGLLDDRERREIADIDRTLDRLADGTYGRCTRCEEPIELDRLTALPETAVCVRCATALEAARAATSPARAPAGEVPSDFELLSDREIEALVRETIEGDERIDHEELRISCRHGVVRLDGVLPSDGERTMVRRIVEDVLGFRDVVDHVRIDAGPWERAERSRTQLRRRPPAGFDPIGTDDAVESAEEGISYLAADRPPAEEE